jgi:hypothetical protein
MANRGDNVTGGSPYLDTDEVTAKREAEAAAKSGAEAGADA